MREVAFLLLIAALLWPQANHSQTVTPKLREWAVTVSDGSGQLVRGLGMEDFQVEDNGIIQAIDKFSTDPDIPVSVGLLIDATPATAVDGSLTPQLGAMRIFLRSFAKPGDEFVLTMNSNFKVKKPSGDAASIDRALLALYPTDVTIKSLDPVPIKFGELMVQASEETKRLNHRRQGLIVTTGMAGGLDSDKDPGRIRSAELPVFIMTFPDVGVISHSPKMDHPPNWNRSFTALSFEAHQNAGTLALESQFLRIAEETGGQTEFFTRDKIHAAERVVAFAQRASSEIRGQYLIGYSVNASDTFLGTAAQIRVPKFPQYHVRYRPSSN